MNNQSTELMRSDANQITRYDNNALSAAYGQADNDAAIQIDAWYILSVLRKYFWLIVLITIVGTALAYLKVSREVPTYRSTATIEFNKHEQKILGSTDPFASTIADREYVETQIIRLKSKALAEYTATRSNLYKNKDIVPANTPRREGIKIATAKIRSGLKIASIPRTRILKVSHEGPHPQASAAIVNALITSYLDSTVEQKFKESERARNFLSERLAESKKNLEKSERILVEYARDENIFDLRGGTDASSLEVNSIVALNDALSTAQSKRIEAEQAFLTAKAGARRQEILENPAILDLKQRLSQLTSEYREKSSLYKPKYPIMVNLQERITALEAELESEKQTLYQALIASEEQAYEAMKSNEKALAEKVRGLKASLQTEQQSRIQYKIIQRDVETARTQYEGLLQRLKDVTISSGVGASLVSVVDKAEAARSPFRPNLKESLLLAFLASLSLGTLISLGLNYLDDTIKTPEDIKRAIGLPTLAVVPKFNTKDSTFTDMLQEPKSQISEAFLSARTSLDFAISGGRPKSLIFTSTQPSEGKSTSVAAAAFVYARMGSRVLLIDADMRKPSFLADTTKTIGLSGLLASSDDMNADLLQNSILKAEYAENLFLLPVGVIPPNPAELLSSPRMVELLKQAEDLFDIVLIDAPPVLAFADSPHLSRICQGTMLVVRSQKIRPKALKRTAERINESGGRILGTVLTHFNANAAGYDSGTYYAYGSGAYSYGEKKNITSTDKEKLKLSLFEKG